jgi:hypothetical protein
MVTLSGIMALVLIGKEESSHCARVNTTCGLSDAPKIGLANGLQDFPMCVLVMEKIF